MKRFVALSSCLPVILLCFATSAFARLVATIPVGTVPERLAVNPTTNRIYVANLNSNNVSVIDGSTNTVVATIPVGNSPYDIAVNPITNMIYVPNAETNNVSVIDGSTNTVVATINNFSFPIGVAVNSTTNQVFVANNNGNDVAVIDGATNTIIATVPVGRNPAFIAVASTANQIYVGNTLDGTISVIDTNSDTVASTFTISPSAVPGAIAWDPITNHLFVTDGFNSCVYVLDASSGDLLHTITAGGLKFDPTAVVMFQPGKTILISDYSLSAVIEVNETTYAMTAGLKGGSTPIGISVNRATGNIYVVETGNGTVNVYSH